jgi:hypothetical protein
MLLGPIAHAPPASRKERLLLAMANLAPHPTFFPAYLAPPFAFPHLITRPFENGATRQEVA